MCESRRTRKSTVDYYVHDDTESDDDFQSNPSKKTRKEKLSTKSSRLTPRLAASENAITSVVVQLEQTNKVQRISSPASSSSSAECPTVDKENVGPSCISIKSPETTSLEVKSSDSSEISLEEDEEEEDCVKITDEENGREEVADLNVASTSSGGRHYRSAPKWTPPVNLAMQSKRRNGDDRQLPEAIVARGSCTPSGLRLGLSRIAKVKSLHGNVKS